MSDTLKGNIVNPEKIYGKSAYEIAVMHGFDGTEEEWLYFLAEQANKIAMVYAEEAAKSEANASAFNISARQHDENAGAAARRAETAETGAKGAKAAATLFANNALSSQNAAKASETNAKASETNAKKSEDNAKASEDNAKASEKIAVESAESAAESAKSAHDAGYTGAEEAISDLKISWNEEKTSAIAAIEASKRAMIEEVESEIAEEKESLLEDIEIAAEIVQTTGDSETAVMSQKAVTKELNNIFEDINVINKTIDGVTVKNFFDESIVVEGYYFGADGAPVAEADSYYMTDFVPIDNTKTYKINTDHHNLMYNEYTVNPITGNYVFSARKWIVDSSDLITFGNTIKAVKFAAYRRTFPNGFIFAYADDYDYCTPSYGVSLDARKMEGVKEARPIVINKDSSILYIIKLNGYDIAFKKTENADIRANLWNIDNITKNGTVIVPSGTDIIGVLKEEGEADFMGGVHGDETNVYTKMYADGKEVSGSTRCNTLDIVMYSHLTRVSTGDNIVDRFTRICFKDDTITVETSFKCLVDNFSLNQLCDGGMFAWYAEKATNVFINDRYYDVNNHQSVPASNTIYSVTVALENDVEFTVENIIGKDREKYTGQVFYYSNEANPRQKIYFMSDRNSTWNSGHVANAKAQYVLR